MESPSRLIYFSNEFPPADLQTLLRRLYVDSKDKRHPHLSRFLEEATAAVRDEVEKLPLNLRRLVPHFESVQSLAADRKLRRGVLSGSIDGVLLCIIQIGSFIRYCETKSGQFNLSGLGNTLLAGLGLGLLVATTVSLAPSLEVLPSVGAEVISIAFRLGCFVAQVSQTLEPLGEEGTFDSWAYVVHGATTDEVQQELESIHSRQVPYTLTPRRKPRNRTQADNSQRIPEAAKIFISAKSTTSVTISGPPSHLKELFRTSSFFRNQKSIALPVYGGLCHAPHVYTEQDADQVVGSLVLEQELFSRFPILAPSNGTPFLGGSASQLFQQIIFEILTRQVVWDKIVDYVSANIGTSQSQGIELMAFGNSLPIQDLQTALNRRETKAAVNVVDLLTSIIDVESSSQAQKARLPRDSKIAIVGMACRLPGGAVDPDKLWNILEEGLDVHRVIPQDRFDVESHYDPERKNMNASHTQFGCFVDAPGLFDAGFFNMSPREAEQTDPMQRLALVTAFEALERAGFVVGRTLSSHKTRVGTWYGQASDDYREVNTAQEIGTYFIPGGCRAFGPGRINYFFKFSGPSFSCDTACSSSLATIQAACTSLWNGEVDTVVAGGMNILTNSDAFAGLSNGHFLTKTPNACKTWDIDADGYCRADGVVSFVMKRLEDAEKDNDNILGVILAAATNHSADAVSITHPHAGSQEYLYRKVLERAGVDPFDVSYIEAHGTGTQAGDIQELTSVTDVFAPLSKRRTTKQPLHIGAVKSNVGHGEAVAGATALLKVLLMFEREIIPPHVGIKTALNPKLPTHMDQRNIHIPFEATRWPRTPNHKRLAMVNSFSAAGGNTSLLLEDVPSLAATEADPRPSHTVVVSAKSKVSFKGNIERLLSYLESHPAVHLSHLAYTTTARRQHYNYRFAFHVAEVDGLRTQLYSSLKQLDAHRPISSTLIPSVAFTFTGQGASFKSSNLQLFHHSPIFRSQILTLDAIARRLGFLSFIPAIDGSHDKDHDHGAVITHIALTCMEIALARYWESLGVKPDVVLGHSLGEYAALCVAGVLSASDTICLVGKRAEMLQEKCTGASHSMLAVRASVEEIRTAAGDLPYEVACINGPKSTVLGGTWQDLEAVRAALISRSHHCATIDVPFAFHSAQTDPILQDFEAFAREGIIFREPRIPIISPLLAEVFCDGKTVDSAYLRKATRETCDFLGAVNKALEIGIIDKDVFWIEMGPHPVNTSFLKATLGPNCVALPSLRRGEDNWTTLADSLATLHSAGLDVDWNEFHRPFEMKLRLLDLPTYSWNNKNYWIQYNGDWALVKGNKFYEGPEQTKAALLPVSSFRTSLVQAIIHEEFHGTSGIVTMQSDLMSAEFFAAAHGHNMNGCGVVTSSIHADIAYTLSEYMTKKLGTPVKYEHFNVANLKVVKGLVVQTDTSRPQLIRVTASTSNIANGINMQWHNTNINGTAEPEPFATATVLSGDADEYLRSWVPITHLVESRIETLQDMARRGQATQFSSKMAYSLFASSLVNYADKYRGMRSVVMHEFEAFADVQLTTEKGGIWTVPPYFIDSVAHLAGFVMNVTDAHDTAGNFCVTPGWQSMVLARRLEPGVQYRSYVKMIPSRDDTGVFCGDVYIIRGREIVGMVGGIQFRRYPRILLDRFFSPPDSNAAKLFASSQIPPKVSSPKRDAPCPVSSTTFRNKQAFLDGTKNPVSTLFPSIDSSSGPSSIASALGSEPERGETPATETDRSPEKMLPASEDPNSIAVKATLIIASQTGIDVADLSDDTRLGDVGVDSLMSLVIAERFRGDLDIAVNSSLFLEYPTLGALKDWLRKYYN